MPVDAGIPEADIATRRQSLFRWKLTKGVVFAVMLTLLWLVGPNDRWDWREVGVSILVIAFAYSMLPAGDRWQRRALTIAVSGEPATDVLAAGGHLDKTTLWGLVAVRHATWLVLTTGDDTQLAFEIDDRYAPHLGVPRPATAFGRLQMGELVVVRYGSITVWPDKALTTPPLDLEPIPART